MPSHPLVCDRLICHVPSNHSYKPRVSGGNRKKCSKRGCVIDGRVGNSPDALPHGFTRNDPAGLTRQCLGDRQAGDRQGDCLRLRFELIRPYSL